MSHTFSLRVYYEDTDLAGVVYYANYLKFIERARSEAIRSIGIDQKTLKAEHGIVFVVRKVEADYLMPAKYDDVLTVASSMVKLGAASIELSQDITREDEIIFTSKVRLACMEISGKVLRFPSEILKNLKQL